MEHVLTAPATGSVTVTAVQGAQVGLDEVLATVVDEAAAEAADASDEDSRRTNSQLITTNSLTTGNSLTTHSAGRKS